MRLKYSAICLIASCGSLCSATDRTLKYGSPESVGLLAEPLDQLPLNLTKYTIPANYGTPSHNVVHPIQPGGSVVIGHKSTIVSSFAFGNTNMYSDSNGTLLPPTERTQTKMDTIYDMASLTKVFTAVAALRAIDEGKLSLDKTVASYLPEFAANGKSNITVLMLLTHTSGFAPDPLPGLYEPPYKTMEQRVHAIIEHKLENAPGSTYTYSDLNFMNLRFLLEKVTKTPFEEETTSPPNFHYYARMAPTEYQIEVLGGAEPKRPQPVRGTVHDENAWALGGVSGHAGLFSTAGDVAIFCQMILNNGTYGGKQILKPKTVDLMFTDFNTAFPGNEHSIGFELNQNYFSGPMANMLAGGHTGFTGTTLVVDRASDTFMVMLAHRVYPNRNWASNNIVREAVGYWVARSLGRDVSFP
ncbi:Beta-lactamase-related protein [Penicillium cf. griseofulvum]|nr:Beta-lactamase-related protein [Penicillium cf. griseofulvum]